MAVGGQEAVLARLGSPKEAEAVVGATCRLWRRGAQGCCLYSTVSAQGGSPRAGILPVLRAFGLRTGHVTGGVLGGQD